MKQRDIKFRVWDVKSKIFGYFRLEDVCESRALFDPDFDYKYVWGAGGKLIKLKGENIIQEFTGMLDIEGNQIYEGDIVENLTLHEEFCSPAVVLWGKYEEVGWALAYNPSKKRFYEEFCEDKLKHEILGVSLYEEFCMTRFGEYKVIGNIFEDFHLIKFPKGNKNKKK